MCEIDELIFFIFIFGFEFIRPFLSLSQYIFNLAKPWDCAFINSALSK